jgi:peptidyl-prolyl cis-trans isomerase C
LPKVEPEPVVPDEQVVPEALPQVEPEPEAPQTSPDDVIVTVNGIDIKRAKIDEMVNTRMDQIKARSRGRKLNEDHLKSMKDRLLRGAIEAAITEILIAQKMQEHSVTISEQQIEEYIAWMAARQRMTVEDLKDIITSRELLTYEQWKEQMQFDKRIGVLKLTEIEGMGTPDINDADVLEFYEKSKARYETPEQVKASHILIKPDDSPTADPNTADADARAKAEELLEQVKQGADFAQLAMENSACPSSSKGGDLGFGQRRSWVGPFADAAFAMQPGEISDVVKTRFGYHIIKITERKEADLTPLDEAKDDILMMLQGGREAELASKYVKSLRNAAEVVYAEGQQLDESERPLQ